VEKRERRCYKALYFDLSVKALKRYFSGKNPKDAYRKIQNYFVKRNFSHEQYSGYHSQYKTTDLEIFQLTQGMRKIFPWLEKCINRFEVTDVGENYNLMKLFQDENTEMELHI
jgi:virulence-associated protein VapD